MFDTLVKAAATSFGASAVAVVVLALATRRRPAAWLAGGSALLATAAFVVGRMRLGPLPDLPPHTATGWVFWTPAVAGVLGATDALAPRLAKRFDIPLALSGLGAFLILRRLTPHHFSSGELALAVGASGTLLFLLAWLPEAVERRRDAPLPRLPMLVALAGSAATVGWSGSAGLSGALAVLLGAVAGAWAVLTAVSLRRPVPSLAWLPAMGLGVGLLGAWAYASLTTAHALMCLGAGLCVLVDRRGTWWVASLGLAASLALVGTAGWQAWRAAAASWPSMFAF